MLLALTTELLNCLGSVLPFLLLFEISILIHHRNTGEKVLWPHFAINLVFVWLLTIMLDLTGIPSIRLLFGYVIITDHGLIIPAREVNFIPFHYLAADVRPYLENIMLFIPFGFLLPLLWERYRPFWKTVFCGFLLSLVIELSQLFNRRITDIDDLLMNTLGTFAGWLLWLLLRKCFSAICAKIKSSKEQESQIFLLRHEALFDILAALIGMFFLYNPFL